MSDGASMKDMVALFQIISDKRVSDEKFADLFKQMAELLTESSTALAEAAEAAAKPQIDHDALAKALAAAVVAAVKSMPAPVIKLEAPPSASAEGDRPWRRIDIELNRDASGRIGNKLTLTRSN